MRSLCLTLALTVQLIGQAPVDTASQNLRPLYQASLHTFQVVRSGTPINDPTTGIHHAASHLADATPPGPEGVRNLAGGWYNAADYGKWTMMAAISVSYMLHLAADQRRHGNPDPVLLNEARWGLAWLLKMQDADGGVRHKVDSGSVAGLTKAWGQPPERDPTVRLATNATSGDTADFSAVMYQASRAFATDDPTAARQFHKAAQRAYSWLQTHPHTTEYDLFYPDADDTQEQLWAECERSASGELSLGLAQSLQSVHLAEVSWTDPALLGLYSLARSQTAKRPLRIAAIEAIEHAAHLQANAARNRPFHVALAQNEYTWGSAERVLHRASLFVMADQVHASNLLRSATANQLAWMLGNNTMQHSLIVGFGRRPVQHPWHWAYRVYGKAMPGWAVLGPNGAATGADPALLEVQRSGAPPEKCYVDACSNEGSWASNEGEISEEAALLFVTGSMSLDQAANAETRQTSSGRGRRRRRVTAR